MTVLDDHVRPDFGALDRVHSVFLHGGVDDVLEEHAGSLVGLACARDLPFHQQLDLLADDTVFGQDGEQRVLFRLGHSLQHQVLYDVLRDLHVLALEQRCLL